MPPDGAVFFRKMGSVRELVDVEVAENLDEVEGEEREEGRRGAELEVEDGHEGEEADESMMRGGSNSP